MFVCYQIVSYCDLLCKTDEFTITHVLLLDYKGGGHNDDGDDNNRIASLIQGPGGNGA
jgi:hypothetical protein